MKTGIIRRVDDMGCIHIPKALRERLDIGPDTPLEMGIEGHRLVLEKYKSEDDIRHVVRCKDCVYWWLKNELCIHPKHCHGNVACHKCGPDSFCSDGEQDVTRAER